MSRHRQSITTVAKSEAAAATRLRRPIKGDHASSTKAKVMLQGDTGVANLALLCAAPQLVSLFEALRQSCSP
jgi:hypothetical protein